MTAPRANRKGDAPAAAAEPVSFGALLRRHRKEARLSQEALAERAGLGRRTVSDLELRAVAMPRADTVARLADALGLGARERAIFAAAARATPGAHPSPDQAAAPERGEPPFVGRVGSLRAIDRLLGGAGPHLLAFAGEPGIGKSRLLHEAGRRGAPVGWAVLRGGCTRRSAQQSYAPFAAALLGHLRRRPRRKVCAWLEECAWLVRPLPELAEAGLARPPAWALPPEQERRQIFAAVGRFLANVAGPAGTVLLLDDLQWAGPDALDLLGDLIRGAAGTLRVAVAYRGGEVVPAGALAGLLGDLAREGMAEHRELGPLAADEARALLRGALGDRRDDEGLFQRVLERAEGIPYYLVSYARALAAGDGGVAGRGAATAVPDDVGQLVRQRVALLTEGARELLGAAAVMDRRIEPAVLEALAARPGPGTGATAEALEEAVRAGLLAEEADGYRFAHDLVRRVVRGDLGAARRRMLHRRVAEALEERLAPAQRPRRAGELAWHLARGGAAERAVPYALLAGEQAGQACAYGEAAGHYRMALGLARAVGDAARAARAAYGLGRALWLLGRLDAAAATLDEAARDFAALGDRAGELRALADLVQVHADRGTGGQALERVRPLLATIERAGEEVASPELAGLHLRLANLHFMSGRYAEQLDASERGERAARAAGGELLLARASHTRALARWNTGDSLDFLPSVVPLIPVAERLHDGWLLYYLLDHTASALGYMGDFTRGRQHQERALHVAERVIVEPARSACQVGACGDFAYSLGEWQRARESYERALSLMRRVDPSGTSQQSAYPRAWLGTLELAQGRDAEGEAYLRDALEIAGRIGDLQALRMAQDALAERDLLAGRAAAAYARLEPIGDRPGLREPDVTTHVLPLLAWAALGLGREDEAEATLRAAVARALATGGRVALESAHRVEARLAIRRGRWAEAEAALEAALALARAMPHPYAEAKGLYLYGLLDAARGEPGRARGRLEAARAILSRLGERPYADRVGRALAQADGDATG